jgi:hypothetical protein
MLTITCPKPQNTEVSSRPNRNANEHEQACKSCTGKTVGWMPARFVAWGMSGLILRNRLRTGVLPKHVTGVPDKQHLIPQ